MSDEQVSSREVDIDVLVEAVDGEDHHKKDIAYEFSNGRKFEDLGEDGNLYS